MSHYLVVSYISIFIMIELFVYMFFRLCLLHDVFFKQDGTVRMLMEMPYEDPKSASGVAQLIGKCQHTPGSNIMYYCFSYVPAI